MGVAQSWADAVKWYTQAVEAGSARAQYNLAWCYEHGKGVPQDPVRARELYAAAAEQDYEGAREAADRLAGAGGKKGGFLRGLLGGGRKDR